MVERGRQHRAGSLGAARVALCIAACVSVGAGEAGDEVCGGWRVTHEAERVRLERAGSWVSGARLDGCVVEGEARFLAAGARLYGIAARLKVSAEEIEAAHGVEVVMGEGGRWRAASARVRMSDGRATLEGVTPVGSGVEQGVESAKEESER